MDTLSPTILVTWPDRSYDAIYAHVLSRIFPAPGYRWVHVSSVEETLEQLSTNNYDIIITLRDVMFLDDGIELCRAIRTETKFKHTSTPIIIGWIDVGRNSYYEGSKLSILAGANGCFGRVFDMNGVKQMVDTLLDDPTVTDLHDQEISYQEAYISKEHRDKSQ